jgi:hypothetical protein
MGEVVKVVNIEELLSELEFCDLITEDQISNDLPRCPDYPGGCKSCETQKFLDSVNYEELLRRYGGKIRYNLKRGAWEKERKRKLLTHQGINYTSNYQN